MGLSAALPLAVNAATPGQNTKNKHAPAAFEPLQPPAEGSIPVAFLLSDDAVVIDFAGPWEVFENVGTSVGMSKSAFQPYTVAETAKPIKAGGGMTVLPNYTFADAPQPKVIVIPAQSEPSEAMVAWIVNAAKNADLAMSVCTGAFVLAKTGLLDGKAATTHHGAYSEFAMAFPNIALKRGARFVESGKVASSGGLSSGIDLALRVVERYYGRDVAYRTANTLEYQGQGWLDSNSNMAYAKRPVSTDQHQYCQVCDMEVAKAIAPSSVYRRRTYYFCMKGHKELFDASPAQFLVG
jgi:transcriptional regulator GlxA family with amidase domain/YHS domain-containing protein